MRPITHPMQMTDYSDISAAAWRDWLKENYLTVENLSNSRGFSVCSFAEAPLPTPAQRVYTPNGNGLRDRQVCDYYRFHYETALSDFRCITQTAVIADLRSDEYVTNAPDRTDALFLLSETGAPMRQFLLTDLPLLDREKYRALVLINLYKLTSEQKRQIYAWQNAGRSVIALNCPALEMPGGGIRQEVENGLVNVTRGGQFYLFPARTEVRVLREALLTAGVHIYAYTDDVIYACRDYVAINARKGGDKRIYLPHIGTLTDCFTGETPENCEHFTDFTLREGETRLFRIEYDA